MVITQKDINDVLTKALSDQTTTLKTHIDESVSAIRNEIIATLNEENKNLKDKIIILETRNDELEGRINSLEVKLESNLQYQRNSSVVISGIPKDVEHTKLEGIVISIFNQVCFHRINSRDIVACHRLSEKIDSVIIKFLNKKDSVALLNSKLALKQLDTASISPNCQKIYVNEHLTPYMDQIAYKCRCLKRANKIYQTKVENGSVKVLTNKEGSFRWYNVTNDNDLKLSDQDNNTRDNDRVDS